MSYHEKPRKAKKLQTKFIFVSGGVISSVGKGVTTSSIAMLLESRGYTVAPVKCDAYLNVDAGTIRPQEHGEVFVLDDGMETDQDLGNYERFMNTDLSGANYVTNGQLYQKIIQKERNFEYEGEDVEVALHVPEEIINRLEQAARKRKADFVICEIGGTVGEYQNILFIEANRIMKYRDGRDALHIHVGYLPTPPSIGEMKSKPVQNSVKQLISSGIQPDFLIGRAEKALDDRRKETLAWTTNIPKDNIIAAPNVDSIYRVPLSFESQGLTDKILNQFGMPLKKKNTKEWQKLVQRITSVRNNKKEVNVAVVGKYFETGAYQLAYFLLDAAGRVQFSERLFNLGLPLSQPFKVIFRRFVSGAGSLSAGHYPPRRRRYRNQEACEGNQQNPDDYSEKEALPLFWRHRRGLDSAVPCIVQCASQCFSTKKPKASSTPSGRSSRFS
jgi:CTP synthase